MPREQRDFNEPTAALTRLMPGALLCLFEVSFSERHAEGLVDQEAPLFKRGKMHSTTSWLLTVSDGTRPMVRAADTCANGSCFAVELTNNGVRRMDPPQITFGESLRRGHTGTLYLRPGCVPVATASLSELSSKDDVPLRRRAPAPPALLGLTLSLLRQIHPQQAVTPPLPAKR
jgi:hypothetical protein